MPNEAATMTMAQQTRSPRSANGPLMARKIIRRQTLIGAYSRDGALAWALCVERVTRIELALSAWEQTCQLMRG
jgi:hypothetical protein